MRRIIAALFLLIITTVIAQAQTPRASQPIIPENELTGMNEPSTRLLARQAKFSPTTLSGKPVKVSGVITYNFVAQ
jgi:hypothetical protein